MTHETILEGVKAEVAATLHLRPEALRPDQRLVADLGAESIDLIDLAFRLDQRFGIETEGKVLFQITDPESPIASNDPHRSATLADVVENIRRLLPASPG